MDNQPDVASLTARANAGDAGAQYALAASLSRAGRKDDAERWLTLSAENGHADAIYTIATRLLYRSENAEAAATMLQRARERGSTAAARLLGVLSVLGAGMPKDESRALKDLLEIAKGGDAIAARELACILALSDIDDPNISRLLAISGGLDPVAAAFSLVRAKSGRRVEGDLAQFSFLLRRLGYPRAGVVSSPPLPPSVNSSGPDWEAVAGAVSLSPKFNTAPEKLAASPDIVLLRQAVAPEICEYVIAHAASRLGPSLVYDPTQARMMRDPLRNSSTASLSPIDHDLALIALNRAISAVAGCAEENGEFLSVLSYSPGQQYRPHLDCIPPGPDFDASGQRVKTALLFLNDDFEGGETHFTEIDLRVRGRPGDILVFSNVKGDGLVDPAVRHAGLPVIGGMKWIASKWFREKKYRY